MQASIAVGLQVAEDYGMPSIPKELFADLQAGYFDTLFGADTQEEFDDCFKLTTVDIAKQGTEIAKIAAKWSSASTGPEKEAVLLDLLSYEGSFMEKKAEKCTSKYDVITTVYMEQLQVLVNIRNDEYWKTAVIHQIY